MTVEHNRLNYVYIDGLDDTLRNTLETTYHIQSLDIEDIFTDTQLSKIEQRPNYLYIALQFPEFDKSKGQFLNKEVHCIISQEVLLVINKHEFKGLTQFNNLKNVVLQDNPGSFNIFYEMLDFIVTRTYKTISKFKQEITQIERDIFDFEDSKDLVKDILIIKRNIINFASIIVPLDVLIRDLQSKRGTLITSEGIEKLDDSLDKIKKMLNNLNNFKEQMALLTESNEALIARSTNETIQALTIVNIIVLIPTVIASFFGMNIFFGWDPVQMNYWPLIVIITTMIGLTIATFIYFKKQRWIK
jgi:Mg2+ and Co2+ transporter CorA